MGYSGSVQSASAMLNKVAHSTPPTPIGDTKVRNNVTNLEDIASSLHEAISRLEDRVDVVLTPVPPEVAGTSPAGARTPSSHFNNRLDDLRLTLENALYRVNAVTARVEL